MDSVALLSIPFPAPPFDPGLPQLPRALCPQNDAEGKKMIRVLLADDKAWLRSAMRLLLEQDPDVEIIGEAAEAHALLTKARLGCPHLVLLDWELPGLESTESGRILLMTLHEACPAVHVLVLSGRPEVGHSALAAGADYFVSKADPPEALLAALHQAKLDNALI
jgi:DNA-binding NarL/FixJ family response regulator